MNEAGNLDLDALEDRKKKEIEHSRKRRDVLQGFERYSDTNASQENEKLDEIHTIFHKLIVLVTKNQVKILQEVDQRIKNHESKFEHKPEFHSSLRCNSS